jgi:hypothetical protein
LKDFICDWRFATGFSILRFEVSVSGRRALILGGLTALLWALAIWITGGIAIETGWKLISSRNPVRPLIAGIVLLTGYLAVWRRHWREDLGPFAHAAAWPPAIAAAATGTALIVGVGWGTRIGAGPDPSGYVSQAAMFARGELTLETPPWAQNAAWDDAGYSAAPVGWHPTHQTHILAPTYSPGLPLIMAAVQTVAGFDAIFYVVPLLGGVLVLSAYLLGSGLAGPWVGAVAAGLVVSSPTFLLLQQQVMSDVPVAAFLTVAVAAALHGAHPWLAGVAAGAAVLTRPNLVPLVAVPMILIAAGERPLRRLAACATPLAVACAIVGWLNWRYHGSPLISGYGPLAAFYSLHNIGPNLIQYGLWFVMLHTPLPLIGSIAPAVVRSDRWRIALVTLGLPAAALALYLPFLVFHRIDWGYTRFLLPAYPALFAGFGIAMAAAVTRTSRPVLAGAVAAVIVGAVAAHGWIESVNTGVFMQRAADARFARTVDYVRRLPERSILVSNAHSGTLRFYTGRGVLRFEAVRPEESGIRPVPGWRRIRDRSVPHAVREYAHARRAAAGTARQLRGHGRLQSRPVRRGPCGMT